jgi:hypothetical protein
MATQTKVWTFVDETVFVVVVLEILPLDVVVFLKRLNRYDEILLLEIYLS